ncbi:MAG TPA: exosortase A [Micropepsaceae bacterium]|nr:exosortase A [Micropepsaceae bacterium]
MSGLSAIAGAKSRTTQRHWPWHIGSLAALVGLILFVFQFEVVNAVQVWWVYPAYSHCFLIIPISAWLVWEKRDTLARMTPAVAPKALFVIVPLMLMWLGGKFGTINEARQFAVIGLIEVAILAMLGTRVFRVILFPALYLFFLVPAGQYLIPPMQDFATAFTDVGLTLLGIPHFTEGNIIELPNAVFQVAEACAGLRFLIATLALGVLFAHLTYRKWYKIAVFLAACVIVPLIANGFRCLGIIVLGYLTNDVAAIDADHIVYGWVFNVAILLVLGFLGSLFRDPPPKTEETSDINVRPVSRTTLFALAAGTAFAVSSGPALAYWHDSRPIIANAEILTSPLTIAPWTAARPAQNWRPIYDNRDLEFITSLTPDTSDTHAVDIAVEYYGRIREGHSPVASSNRLWEGGFWHQTESHDVVTNIGSSPLRLNEAVLSSVSEKRLVWSVYWMDSRFVTSGLAVKLLQLKTIFTGNESAAVIALSTPIEGVQEDARTRLRTALTALSELSAHLAAAGRPGAMPPKSLN